jgi:hypothetical protein
VGREVPGVLEAKYLIGAVDFVPEQLILALLIGDILLLLIEVFSESVEVEGELVNDLRVAADFALMDL